MLNIHATTIAHDAACTSAATEMMARMPATKSPHAAGVDQALGSDAETTPGTRKPKPMNRRNMCGAISHSSATCPSAVRSHGHAKSHATTIELARLASVLIPKIARGFIEPTAGANLFVLDELQID